MRPRERLGQASGLVSHVLKAAVPTVSPDDSVREVRRRCRRSRAHHLLVLDQGTLVGILCRCDLEEAAAEATIGDCMSLPVLTIRADATLSEAAALMSEFEVGCLPVVMGGLILGVLSEEEMSRAHVGRRSGVRCRCHRRRRQARAGRRQAPARGHR